MWTLMEAWNLVCSLFFRKSSFAHLSGSDLNYNLSRTRSTSNYAFSHDMQRFTHFWRAYFDLQRQLPVLFSLHLNAIILFYDHWQRFSYIYYIFFLWIFLINVTRGYLSLIQISVLSRVLEGILSLKDAVICVNDRNNAFLHRYAMDLVSSFIQTQHSCSSEPNLHSVRFNRACFSNLF